MVKKVKVVDISKKNEKDLFAIGNKQGEYYFLSRDIITAEYFDELYYKVKYCETNDIKERPYALVETNRRTATLIDPAEIGNTFSEHNISLDYTNISPKAILIEPWNGAGDLFDISYVVNKHDFELPEGRRIDFNLKRLIRSWDWILSVDSREIFYEYCNQSPPVKVIKEGPISCMSVFCTSDYELKDKIFERVYKEKVKEITRLAISEKVDLILMGLFTPDNASHIGMGIGDLCDVNDRNGLTVVSNLRKNGYQGNIVAVKSMPYTMPDTYFNKMVLHSLHEQGVVLSPSTQKETLCKILTGGKFKSDYRLDGTPAEIKAYREAQGLSFMDPIRSI